MHFNLTIFFVLFSQLVCAQELKDLRHCQTIDYKYDFYITFSEKKVKYEDTLHYFWFKAKKIHVTQGSSEGNLLNGPFSKFYYSGQLAERGEFEMGLKEGEWKSWYESGNLRSIYNYNSGILSGSYTLYNENGDVRESGKIRKGEKKVDEEKEGWFKRRRKIKKALNPNQTKKEKKELKKQKRQERKENRKTKREERKIERERRLSTEGSFFNRLFKVKKKKKKS